MKFTDEHRANLSAAHFIEEPGNAAVHWRLRTQRGKAAAYSCADCGDPAREWAYKDPSGFSRDLDDYRPVCRSCHRKQDTQFKHRDEHTGRWT